MERVWSAFTHLFPSLFTLLYIIHHLPSWTHRHLALRSETSGFSPWNICVCFSVCLSVCHFQALILCLAVPLGATLCLCHWLVMLYMQVGVWSKSLPRGGWHLVSKVNSGFRKPVSICAVLTTYWHCREKGLCIWVRVCNPAVSDKDCSSNYLYQGWRLNTCQSFIHREMLFLRIKSNSKLLLDEIFSSKYCKSLHILINTGRLIYLEICIWHGSLKRKLKDGSSFNSCLT